MFGAFLQNFFLVSDVSGGFNPLPSHTTDTHEWIYHSTLECVLLQWIVPTPTVVMLHFYLNGTIIHCILLNYAKRKALLSHIPSQKHLILSWHVVSHGMVQCLNKSFVDMVRWCYDIVKWFFHEMVWWLLEVSEVN